MDDYAPLDSGPKTYKLWDIDSIFELEPPEWLIEDVLPRKGSALVYGQTNAGKSLVALDWAFRLASGWMWMGKEVKQSSVLYVYAEGGHDLQLRYQAWVEGYDHRQPVELQDNLHFIGLDEEIRLRWDADAEAAPEGVQRLFNTVDPNIEGNRRYDVIIFDPATEVWRGMDGNDSREVSMAWRVVKELQRMHDAAAVIVHHTRKDGDTFRGSTTWLDLADTGFAVMDEGNELVKVLNTKNRFSEKGHGYLLRRYKQNIERVDKLFGKDSVFLGAGHYKAESGSEEERRVTFVLGNGPMSMTEIHRKMDGVSETTVRRLLKTMEENGMIERDGNRGPYRLVTDSTEKPEEV